MQFKKAPRVVAVAALGAAAVLALGACGSSSDDSADATPTTAAEMPTTTAAPDTAVAPAQTVVEIAAGNPDFSTLVSAVEAVGLAETLSGDGPFTVFAPTNAAFEALPAGTLESLLKPANEQQLTDILTYHVVPATVMAKDVEPGDVTTVNGATFEVAAENGGVTITDGEGGTAKVVTTDIVASNGVIHVIDAVLIPPTE
jgi:uncharacterized surface protein with fasciclin (FAS1) repeats